MSDTEPIVPQETTSEELSPNNPTELTAGGLTLRAVRDVLEKRGVVITYTALSDLISAGDVTEQLGLAKGHGRKSFQPAVVDILTQFIPQFRAAEGKLTQAGPMLRSFLSSLLAPNNSPTGAAAVVRALPDPVRTAEIQGRAQGWGSQDKVFDAAGAAAFLGVSKEMLRKTVKPFKRFGSSPRGDRWRLSDLLSGE